MLILTQGPTQVPDLSVPINCATEQWIIDILIFVLCMHVDEKNKINKMVMGSENVGP